MLKTSKSTGRRYCPDHPTYLARRKPILACEDCWVLYLGMSDACHASGCCDCCADDGCTDSDDPFSPWNGDR